MSVSYYPAIIAKDEGVYTVMFPDVPGCVTQGETMTKAAINAHEALALHLEVADDLKIAVAVPTAIENVEIGEGSAVVLIEASRPGKAVRINLTIDEGLLERIDRHADNRSRFLTDAARQKLASEMMSA